MTEGEPKGSILLDGVTKTYGDVVAIDDITMSIDHGIYHCLLGPNGSGKSTLLRLILGLTQQDTGTITTPSAIIGCGFQQPNFYPALTVRENIDIFASIVDADDWDWNQRVVDELRLNPALERKAADLSGGYERKLDLTLAMIKKPDFLLLDEPLGALDDVSKARFLEFLDDYADEGNSILVSTHNVTAFEPYIDRVTLLHRGAVVFDDLVSEIDIAEHQSLQEFYVSTILERENVESFEKSVVE